MGGIDPTLLTIAELAPLFRRRALSPVEVVRAVLARIDALEGQLGAYVTVLRDGALAAAAEAEREIGAGAYRGPLHGIPIALKDLVATRGIRTTAGSRVLADWVPDRDATIVDRLRQAGAILLGKTHLHEFAYGPTGVNPHYGTPRNPWDPARIPGGSSSGSGVAVAAGLCVAAIGTDTGGSVRIPASLCGIVGLKPTYGRVSRRGVVPLAWSLDHVGPMTRCVADAALILQALAGPDPEDLTTVDLPPPALAAAPGDLRGLAIGVPRDHFFEAVAPETEEAVRKAIATLEGLGARAEEVSLPNIHRAGPTSVAIIASEALAYHEDLLRTRWREYGAEVRTRLASGRAILAAQYLRAQRARQVLRQEVDRALGRVEILAAPTTAVPATRLDEAEVRVGGRTEDVRWALIRLTRPLNVTGHPAISIPCGFTAAGLPVGLQLIGRRFDEATLLRVAHAYEAAAPWRGRRLPL